MQDLKFCAGKHTQISNLQKATLKKVWICPICVQQHWRCGLCLVTINVWTLC